MPVLPADSSDPSFLRHAIRHGKWERYEHPTKGETFTLEIGNFPILSIHSVLVEGPDRPVDEFWSEMASKETMALLLAKVATLSHQLKVAADVIAAQGLET